MCCVLCPLLFLWTKFTLTELRVTSEKENFTKRVAFDSYPAWIVLIALKSYPQLQGKIEAFNKILKNEF